MIKRKTERSVYIACSLPPNSELDTLCSQSTSSQQRHTHQHMMMTMMMMTKDEINVPIALSAFRDKMMMIIIMKYLYSV